MAMPRNAKDGISTAKVINHAEQASSATAMTALPMPASSPGTNQRWRGCARRSTSRAALSSVASDMTHLLQFNHVVCCGHDGRPVTDDDHDASLVGQIAQPREKTGLSVGVQR